MTSQMPRLTPAEFVAKWERAELKERASYQEHFIDVCRLVGHPTPAELDPTGEEMTFEYGVKKLGGGQGYADVFYRGHFAIEYKGKGKYATLDDAYRQLQQYREHLLNPPLLVVCDIDNWEIHTNWPNTAKKVHRFKNAQIALPYTQRLLHALFWEPNALHPERSAEQVTADAAQVFQQIAQNMRGWEAAPERIAHFLTKLVFCLFAEDVGLLPIVDTGKGIFTEIIAQSRQRPAIFARYLHDLFTAMQDGGEMLFREVPFFNGGLFENVDVEELSLEALTALERACLLDWSAIQPAIFGQLFERSLDPAKRAQLGAHYTSEEDIRLIVEPVLMQPLRREWEATKAEAAPIRAAYEEALAERNKRKQQNRLGELEALRDRMLERLRSVTVLDPACGSGNFLYVALQALLDLEKEVRRHPLFADLPLAFPGVHPRQLHGIEINPIAHDLASIVVWIGYIQWWRNNGEQYHSVPILEALDTIQQKDAILGVREDGTLYDPEWPSVDVIVSNPPFLGDKKMRTEMGDGYVDQLRKLYSDRIPGQSDLVCYWFERAREMIETNKVKRAGLLATNSIRGGANRVVLERIKQTGDIFMAWSDRDWILEGAAVRVSMVGFDDGREQIRSLDGRIAPNINPDLTASSNITSANRLVENIGLAFIGDAKKGQFDIGPALAERMLNADNQAGTKNRDVLKPWVNGLDITRRSRAMWIVDFGVDMSESQARLYELPYQYVLEHVKPARDSVNNELERQKWWLHGRAAPAMRQAVQPLSRYIGTPRVAKHRTFVWLEGGILPDIQIVVVARDDDYFFGVLHSRIHEVWALRMGTWLGKGNDPRYTPTTTFETFPFPWPPGQEPVVTPTTPTPNPSPINGEGNGGVQTHPSPISGEGPGMGVVSPGMGVYDTWELTPWQEQAMTRVARILRKEPTPSEALLWEAIRKRQLDGRKFRRQMPIGPFVVDFYCSSERLIVEVDGPIHDSQVEADRERQALLESLGLRFVRVTAAQVAEQLPAVLAAIRAAFAPTPSTPTTPTPGPSPINGEGNGNPGSPPSPAPGSPASFPRSGGRTEDGGMGAYLAIAAAAKQLHAERDAWLNPPGVTSEKALKNRTLTNLYNALNVWRGIETIKVPPEAAGFAPRLDALHRALDAAVCDAYGWPHEVLDDEEEILRRLLALNLERAGRG